MTPARVLLIFCATHGTGSRTFHEAAVVQSGVANGSQTPQTAIRSGARNVSQIDCRTKQFQIRITSPLCWQMYVGWGHSHHGSQSASLLAQKLVPVNATIKCQSQYFSCVSGRKTFSTSQLPTPSAHKYFMAIPFSTCSIIAHKHHARTHGDSDDDDDSQKDLRTIYLCCFQLAHTHESCTAGIFVWRVLHM